MFRIGIGYDIHKFDTSYVSDCEITLCGVKIKHRYPILAHSDGDVVFHSVTDALLGSVAAGSIGVHFPPSDDRWKGASSDLFLKHANNIVLDKRYRIGNIDITIICEEPKIMPHAQKMREIISVILEINIDQVNIKAVTAETLGAIGRCEGIAVQSAVLVHRASA